VSIRRLSSVLVYMALVLTVFFHALGSHAAKSSQEDQKKDTKSANNPEPDVPYWPTPMKVVDKMLELADVKKGDVVYDLGCGDARILVTAAKRFGVKGFGFDIDAKQVQDSLDNVKKNKLEDLVTIKKADIFTLDLRDASVVTLYLMPELNVRLIPQLEKLKPGSRIVSHDWDMKGAKPNKMVTLRAKNEMGLERVHKIYLWIVPWEKE
jgi:SAM-dependent methyltransferase